MKLPTITKSPGTAATAQFLRTSQVVGLLLILIGVFAFASQARATEQFPLDRYPGFGRSPAAAQRDDTIAAWEAFRREQIIAACMERSGFEYLPAVAFPEGAFAAVAKSLGVTFVGPAEPRPLDQNMAYAAKLAAKERERYFQALYGESAADVAELWRTGQVPSGRGADFATRGCVGEANAAVPSVWSVRRELESDLGAMRQELAASSEMVATGDAYSACAHRVGGLSARGPGDVEALAAADSSALPTVTAVIKECASVWAAGYRRAEVAAMQRFEQRNSTALRSAEERYRGMIAMISADQAFRRYLAQYADPAVSSGR